MAKKAPTTILLRTNKPKGFSLIEILIVLAIISMVLAASIPSVWNIATQKLSSTTRKFSGLIRTVRNDAILLNKVHRMVINLDDQTWWVEQQANFKLIRSPEQAEEQDEEEDKGVVLSNRDGFGTVDKYGKEPRPMPEGIVFNAIYSERWGSITEGVAYIHFFPNGYIDSAALFMAREGKEEGYGLVIQPSNGRAEIIQGSIDEYLGQ